MFVFFKQKTAYEMRISDWSSDVCSSDLFKPKRKVRLRGNHENRLERYLEANPVLEGLVGLHLLKDDGWEVVPYFSGAPGVIHIDGIAYAHYFANPNTGKIGRAHV